MDNKLIGDGMVFRILKLIEETLNFTHVVVASTNALDSVEHGVKINITNNDLYLYLKCNVYRMLILYQHFCQSLRIMKTELSTRRP